MGAWSTDIIGYVQCDSLGGQHIAAKNGTTSYQAYCYEMKVIQAFSWMNFILFVLALVVLYQLTGQARLFGRFNIWREPIRELPWFGEAPGYYNTGIATSYGGGAVPYMYPTMAPYAPAMAPGSAVIVQPGINGQPATITQVPV